MNILRVFPSKTKDTPEDAFVAIGYPSGYLKTQLPEYVDEVHVSVTFTWDKPKAADMVDAWCALYGSKKVKHGGPAIYGEGDQFTPGMYLRHGITITSRGCPNNCAWCLVDGAFREIDIKPGWIIQDNNLLAASAHHFRKVIDMLKTQRKAPIFRGGFEARRLKGWHIENLKRLKYINEIWFACDRRSDLGSLKRARDRMRWLDNRRKLRCYVMLGKDETIEDARDRLESVWDLGFLPFAQLYQPPQASQIRYSKAWEALAREWSRPAAMFANHK